MARTAQISKEKQQSIITLRHEGQSISRILKDSSSAVAKIIKCHDETVSDEDHYSKDPELPLLQRISSLQFTVRHEDCHRKGRPRVTSAAEDKFITVNCLS